jgi:hypothetical protein
MGASCPQPKNTAVSPNNSFVWHERPKPTRSKEPFWKWPPAGASGPRKKTEIFGSAHAPSNDSEAALHESAVSGPVRAVDRPCHSGITYSDPQVRQVRISSPVVLGDASKVARASP